MKKASDLSELMEQHSGSEFDEYPGGLGGYVHDKIAKLKSKTVRKHGEKDPMRNYWTGVVEALEAVELALQGDLSNLKYL
jgi:hypothetical protein